MMALSGQAQKAILFAPFPCDFLGMASIQQKGAESGSDLDLVDKVRAGDMGAYEQLVRQYERRVFRIAQNITQNREDAEDVVQDAALRAFRGIRGFGAVNARAWSLTIVRNTAYSWLTKNRPKSVVFTDDLSVTEQQELEHEGPQGTRIETPEEIALFKAEAEDVQRALAQLPAHFREVDGAPQGVLAGQRYHSGPRRGRTEGRNGP